MEQDKELNIKMLFASLAEKGIVEIHIGFDGSGDSGSIDDDTVEVSGAGDLGTTLDSFIKN